MFEQFRDRMKTGLGNPVSRIEGSFSMDNIQAVAQELARLQSTEIDPITNRVFLDTAAGSYLDRKALEFYEQRKPATPATGDVTFTGATGFVVPPGTVISTDRLFFNTVAACTISEDGTATAEAVCEAAGAQGNVPAGAIKNIASKPDGLYRVSNQKAFGGGAERESDDAFRARLLEKLQKPIASGNPNHYEYWAKQVPGVGKARCFPTWAGAGTVKVVILSDTGEIPDDEVLEKTKAHIEENRPVGADVTVAKAQSLPVTVAAEVRIVSGYTIESVEYAIRQRMSEFFSTIAFDGKTTALSFLRVGDLIFHAEGVEDILSYTVNMGTSAIPIAEEQFCIVGAVTVNAQST